MKQLVSKKISLDHILSILHYYIEQVKNYWNNLDSVTKVFRLMVVLTCVYSVFLLTRIKESQKVLVTNSRLVSDWRAAVTPKVLNESTPSAELSTNNQPTIATISYRTISPSSTPDKTPPRIVQITGPADGATINFNSFCFPIRIEDNKSQYPNLYVQYRLDSDIWSNWSNNMAPCFSDIANGEHVFMIQAKDQTGNISSPISRVFNIQVN